jgi:hypothetical protein
MSTTMKAIEERGWVAVTEDIGYGVWSCTLVDGYVGLDSGYGATEDLAIQAAYDRVVAREEKQRVDEAARAEIAREIKARGWTWSMAGPFTFVHSPHGIGSSMDPAEAFQFAVDLEAKQ